MLRCLSVTSIIVFVLSLAPAAATAEEEWVTVTAEGVTSVTVMPAAEVRGPLGNLVMACHPDGRLTLAYEIEKAGVSGQADSAEARLVVDADPAGRKIIVQSTSPRQDAGKRWSYPMDMKQAAALIEQVSASSRVTLGIAPRTLGVADLLDADLDNEVRFNGNAFALGTLRGLCPKAVELAAADPELPASPPPSPEPELEPTPWLTASVNTTLFAVSRRGDDVLRFSCHADGTLTISLDIGLPDDFSRYANYDRSLHVTSGEPGSGFFLKFGTPSVAGGRLTGVSGADNPNYVIRDAIEDVLGAPGPVWGGISIWRDGENETVAGAHFAEEGKDAVLKSILDACPDDASSANGPEGWSEQEWTLLGSGDGSEAGTRKGNATLSLIRISCETFGFGFSIPSSELHTDLVGRSQVDVIVTRDGSGDYRYFRDIDVQTVGDRLIFGFVSSASSRIFDDIARAGRSVDIALSRDAASGGMRNKIRFTAKGSTAALKALRDCNAPPAAPPPPAVSAPPVPGAGWSVRPSWDGDAYFLETTSADGPTLSLVCLDGAYELSFTVPASSVAPEMAVRETAAISLAATGGRKAMSRPGGIGSDDDTIYFGSPVEVGDEAYDLLTTAGGVLTAGLRAGEGEDEPEFNTTAFVTTGLATAVKEFNRLCDR